MPGGCGICAITRIVLLLCIVHALVHTIVRISLLLPWLPVRFASVLVLHFDSLLNKRGRSFEVSSLIIGVVAAFQFNGPTKDIKVIFSPLRSIVSEFREFNSSR